MTAPEPDFEAIAVEILAAATTVTALVPTTRISTKLPRGWTPAETAIRVRRIGGLPTEDIAAHLCRGRLQVECFAATEVDAFEGAAAAVAALRDGTGTYAAVVITHVGQDFPLRNEPDPDSDAARYLAGVVLYGHRGAG